MYQWEKEKSTKIKQNPSFSSSLLDEIYRSIDGGDDKFGEFNLRKQKAATVKSSGRGGGRLKSKNAVEDKEIANFRQACLVEKWMDNEKGRRLPEFDQKLVVDNDPLFFSSGSSSSDSSFGWYSEADQAVKPKPSCFGPLNRLKTSRCGDEPDDSGLIRSKTRVLKMYATLKKGKQPFSPGGRLTTFINSIFTNANSKKSKSKSTNVSTCSSSTSFSRSFLNQNHPPPTTTTTFPWARMEKPSLNEFMSKYKIDDFEDEDDMASDSSSDLFELDHLTMFKNDKYCEELPVYETTNMGTNRAIASGLVC